MRSELEVYDSYFARPDTVKQTTPPKKTNGVHIADLVVKDLEARKTMGIKKYGTPLQAFNGRNPIQDAYEEAIDLACYLRQVLEESR